MKKLLAIVVAAMFPAQIVYCAGPALESLVKASDDMKAAVAENAVSANIAPPLPQNTHINATLFDGIEATDPLFSKLNYLKAIHVPEAWKISKGEGVIIAVIDDGFFAQHPDMQGAYLPQEFKTSGIHYLHNEKTRSHGPAMAATLAARLNNGHGIVGIAPESKILRISFGMATNFPNTPDEFHKEYNSYLVDYYKQLASAIGWAVQQGARVFSMSFNLVGDDLNNPEINQSIEEFHAAIKQAHEQGVVFVSAAGNYWGGHNSSSDPWSNLLPQYPRDQVRLPARYNEVISAGCVCGKDLCEWVMPGAGTPYSAQFKEVMFGHNYGKKLDFVVQCDLMPMSVFTQESLDQGQEYGFVKIGGTSNSTPVVAGIIALMLAENPKLSPDQIFDILKKSVTDIKNPEFDIYTGYGLLDAFRAVELTSSGL